MTDSQSKGEKQNRSFGLQVWRFFSSLRLTLILIFILVGLSLIGTFVIQVPSWATTDPNSFEQWLEYVARSQTGVWYPFLHLFGFFNVFHSIWFLGAGALLIINIVICSVNRMRRIRVNISPSDVNRAEGFYKAENSQPALPANSETGKQLIKSLKKHRYSVRQEKASQGVYIAADKNRFSPLGTYIIHLSLILLIAGYLVGSYMGFKDNSFIVAEGATQSIGNNTGLSLHLNSFRDEYWPDGTPKDYQSNVDIIENNQVVKSAIVQVNHPLNYQGVRVFQSFFGPATRIQLTDGDGKELFKGAVPLSQSEQDSPYIRPSGVQHLAQNGYIMFIVGRATNTNDAVLNEGQIGFELYKTGSTDPIISTKLDSGITYKSEKVQVTYLGDAKYSGFQISRDPGNSLIWIASGLFVVGLVIVFYFPRRRIWAFAESIPGKEHRLWMRTDSGRKPGAAGELQTLIKEVQGKNTPSKKELT
jgi:cytochrome c biogenesis protein